MSQNDQLQDLSSGQQQVIRTMVEHSTELFNYVSIWSMNQQEAFEDYFGPVVPAKAMMIVVGAALYHRYKYYNELRFPGEGFAEKRREAINLWDQIEEIAKELAEKQVSNMVSNLAEFMGGYEALQEGITEDKMAEATEFLARRERTRKEVEQSMKLKD